jgi:uncharacterized caspase-like protein
MKRFVVVLFSCLIVAAVTAQQQPGDLWVLAIGVNDYSDNNLSDLKFCVSDAQNISNVFKAQEANTFGKVNTLVIADTEAVKPTRENILSSLAFLKNAKQDDTVILYFALHSIQQDGNYYLLPSDSLHESGDKFSISSMIDFNDIVRSLDGECSKIIILDTHYSETAIKAVTGRNIAILGACKDTEFALELALYRSGAFTLGIIEAFNENSGLDNRITLNSLSVYLTDRVTRLSRNRQNPVFYFPDKMGEIILR